MWSESGRGAPLFFSLEEIIRPTYSSRNVSVMKLCISRCLYSFSESRESSLSLSVLFSISFFFFLAEHVMRLRLVSFSCGGGALGRNSTTLIYKKRKEGFLSPGWSVWTKQIPSLCLISCNNSPPLYLACTFPETSPEFSVANGCHLFWRHTKM